MSTAKQPCVLVTGASGFAGRAVVAGLSAQGWQVRAALRQRFSPTSDGVTWVQMPDLSCATNWAPLLDGVDHVVHLAGIAHAQARLEEPTYQRVNAEASRELARAAAVAGVTRFVFLSSVRAQCGPSADGVLTEATPPAPTDAYGRSKLAAERAIAAEFPIATMLRPVLILGPGVKGNLARLQRLARSRLPLPFGALHNRRSVLGLQNLISIIAFCLTADAARAATYLAAEPEPMRVRDLMAAMRAALRRQPGLAPVPPVVLDAAMRIAGRGALTPSLLGALCVDVSSLLAAGWRPATTIESEIIRMMTAPQPTASSR